MDAYVQQHAAAMARGRMASCLVSCRGAAGQCQHVVTDVMAAARVAAKEQGSRLHRASCMEGCGCMLVRRAAMTSRQAGRQAGAAGTAGT
jgi:hypothetical protein